MSGGESLKRCQGNLLRMELSIQTSSGESDVASTMVMQKHAMIVIKKAIEFVNPGQVPVMEGDCPLYAQQKKCQWAYKNEVGESKMESKLKSAYC